MRDSGQNEMKINEPLNTPNSGKKKLRSMRVKVMKAVSQKHQQWSEKMEKKKTWWFH